MSPELDLKLCAAFPILYRDRHRSAEDTCMCWGFTCGDGWFQLIYDLSAQLEKHIREVYGADPEASESDTPVAVQVKEKFGTLRFYLSGHDSTMDAMIDQAEKASAKTCEQCGEPGTLHGGGWIRTLCDKCCTAREWRAPYTP